MSYLPDPFVSHWRFPFKKLPSSGRSWTPGSGGDYGRWFGAKRGSDRNHAGCDLLMPFGDAVYAIADGTVISYGQFTGPPLDKIYAVTYSLVVDHDTYIVRYGEIGEGLKWKKGAKVKAGEKIATVGRVSMDVSKQPMLHFEMFWGDAGGDLTNKTNKGDTAHYWYVPKRSYQRRADLIAPCPYLLQMADQSGLK
ncbi:MAG TPA: M23 family metallopeptidase [Gemmatales bacterium]|nr:M23 family metallopeptidase [Gemmatales bacterium]